MKAQFLHTHDFGGQFQGALLKIEDGWRSEPTSPTFQRHSQTRDAGWLVHVSWWTIGIKISAGNPGRSGITLGGGVVTTPAFGWVTASWERGVVASSGCTSAPFRSVGFRKHRILPVLSALAAVLVGPRVV